MKNKKIRGW